MYATLFPGAIGIKDLSLADSIQLAADTGYAGVTFDVREARSLADEHGMAYVKQLFADRDVKPASWSAPVRWQDDDARDADLAALPALAEVAVELGATAANTGIMPGNNERPFTEQYAFILERLHPLAKALHDHGIRLGIEFIAPKTLRDQFTYEFIYSMKGMLDLAKDVATGNVGVLFDTWHHYTSHGDVDEIDTLTPQEVTFVHVNDAPAGITIDEQQDLSRTLPMETGVIPAPDMLRRLKAIGYIGPVAAEPFSERINTLAARDPVAAATETRESIQKLFVAAGVE